MPVRSQPPGSKPASTTTNLRGSRRNSKEIASDAKPVVGNSKDIAADAKPVVEEKPPPPPKVEAPALSEDEQAMLVATTDALNHLIEQGKDVASELKVCLPLPQ